MPYYSVFRTETCFFPKKILFVVINYQWFKDSFQGEYTLKRKNTGTLIITVIFLLLVTACQMPTDITAGGAILSDTKDIVAFVFDASTNSSLGSAAAGTISGTDIVLTVPYGTDVSGLTATFTTTGTGISVNGVEQNSGTTAIDFSSPVIYTVTAEDGSTQEYTVTVSVAVNTAKELSTFLFEASINTVLSSDASGTISGTDIVLTVPYGTDVSGLVATFTTTGSNVSVNSTQQNSGTTANDFSGPVIYTVTAEDSGTQEYTVTVSVAVNTAKELSTFLFEASKNTALSSDASGTISGTDIVLTVPYGTDVGGLVATFTTSGSSVSVNSVQQNSGDSSTQNYTVTVTVLLNPAKEISAFMFEASKNSVLSSDASGTISGTDIELTVP